MVIPLIMALASFGIVPIMKGAILGVIILLILRSISIHDVYESLNLQVIFLILEVNRSQETSLFTKEADFHIRVFFSLH